MAAERERSRPGQMPAPERLAVWRAFLETHAALVDVLERELMAEQGLPLTWYDVLVQLHDAPDGCLRMQDLARSVLLSKSGLTRLFNRMARAGLVERCPAPNDRRGYLAALTPAGLAVLTRAAPTHLRGIEQHFTGRLTAEETAALGAAFARILSALAPSRPTRPLPVAAERLHP